MTRLVQRHRSGPYIVTVGGEIKSICGCGLSGALPFCDGTHQITKTEKPGKLHWYDSAKQRHDAVDRYSGIRSDETTQSTLSVRAAPSINPLAEPVSDR
jgi:CDGSH-type Zn-finger protein